MGTKFSWEMEEGAGWFNHGRVSYGMGWRCDKDATICPSCKNCFTINQGPDRLRLFCKALNNEEIHFPVVACNKANDPADPLTIIDHTCAKCIHSVVRKVPADKLTIWCNLLNINPLTPGDPNDVAMIRGESMDINSCDGFEPINKTEE